MDEVEVVEDQDKGISTGQWVLLGILGVMGVAAAVLTLAARQAARNQGTVTLGEMLDRDPDAPWAVSLRHLAAATDLRLRGIEERLDNLTVEMGGTLPPPPAPVDKRFPPAPPPPPNGSMSDVPVGATEPPPPGPAATSM